LPGGWLTVTIAGRPAGVDASVLLTGPGGSPHPVKATTKLTLLARSWVIKGTTAIDGDPIVPVVFDGGPATATTTIDRNDPASITITYQQRPGSGHPWLGRAYDAPAAVDGHAHDTLAVTEAPPADIAIAGRARAAHDDLAIDREGRQPVGHLVHAP